MKHWMMVVALALHSGCASSKTPLADIDDDGGASGGDTEDNTGGTNGGGTLPTEGSGGTSSCDSWTTQFYDPGPDGMLGTSDDFLTGGRSVAHYNEFHVITSQDDFSSPGPDGEWDTSDDEISKIARQVKVSENQVYYVIYGDSGFDGQWGTDDDSVSSASWASLDGDGRPVETRTFQGSGADGSWMTDDDPVLELHTITYGDGESTPAVLDVTISSPGEDEVWGTTDDPVSVASIRYSDWGFFATSPGSDGDWGTDDDSVTGRYEDKREWNGYIQWLSSFDSGLDSKYFTTDDPIFQVASIACVDGARDTKIIGASGVDSEWGTEDDYIQVRIKVWGCSNVCEIDAPTSPVTPPQ